MKKIGLLVLCGILLLGMTTACSTKDSSDSGKNVQQEETSQTEENENKIQMLQVQWDCWQQIEKKK